MTFIDADSSGEDCRNLGVTELVLLCARDTGNERIWAEFLRRFAPVIKFFVWRTLRNLRHGSLIPRESLILGIDEENDLFQDTMLRLVNRDCAVMKRFIGTREEEFVAYLAVISKSLSEILYGCRWRTSGPTNTKEITQTPWTLLSRKALKARGGKNRIANDAPSQTRFGGSAFVP